MNIKQLLLILLLICPVLQSPTAVLCAAQPPLTDVDESGPQPLPVPGTSSANTSPVPASNTKPENDATAKKGKIKMPTNPLELVLALSWWAIPFGICSMFAIWFAVERLVVLRYARVIPKPFVTRFLVLLQEGKLSPEEALELCIDNGSSVAQIFEHGVRKWGKPSVEVEQAIIDGGERQIGQLRKHIRWLNGISSITPLIGLLGTVWGIIESFNAMSTAKGSQVAEDLAAGIATALITTAAGLAISIPSMVAYMFFVGRVDQLIMEMDELGQQVVNCISAEALQGLTPIAKPKSKTRTARPKEAG